MKIKKEIRKNRDILLTLGKEVLICKYYKNILSVPVSKFWWRIMFITVMSIT